MAYLIKGAHVVDPQVGLDDVRDVLVREKYVELIPMTIDEALVQIDLIGHDFYMFEDAQTGMIDVVYRRKNGGYGVIKPKIEDEDEQS